MPVAWTLSTARVIDLDAPLGPALVAKLTASLLCAIATGLLFLVARRRCTDTLAVCVSLGFGLGTNVWAVASQTLWTHESVVFGFALAIWAWARARDQLRDSHVWIASAGLGWAGFARPVVAPAIIIIAIGLAYRRRCWRDVAGLTPLLLFAVLAIGLNVSWFGHPLGAMPHLESMHDTLHHVSGSLTTLPLDGALGLLVSPSRGLLIFSPIVLVALWGVRVARREGLRGDLAWWGLAALTQFALYSCYSVWWGGHTYGPRYAIDVVPLLVPLASAGMTALTAHRVRAAIVSIALAWSILLAATGAWCYPADAWNTNPTEIDRDHARLWDWRDPQFVRCWRSGLSPQTYGFLEHGALSRHRGR